MIAGILFVFVGRNLHFTVALNMGGGLCVAVWARLPQAEAETQERASAGLSSLTILSLFPNSCLYFLAQVGLESEK